MTPEESLAKIAQLDLEATKEWVSLWRVIIPSLVTFATVFLAYRFAVNQARTKRNTDLRPIMLNTLGTIKDNPCLKSLGGDFLVLTRDLKYIT